MSHICKFHQHTRTTTTKKRRKSSN